MTDRERWYIAKLEKEVACKKTIIKRLRSDIKILEDREFKRLTAIGGNNDNSN